MEAKKAIPSILGLSAAAEAVGAVAGIGSGLGLSVVAGTGAAAATNAMYTQDATMTTKDHVIAALPTVASAIVAGLTLGWPQAILGLLTGPLSGILISAVAKK